MVYLKKISNSHSVENIAAQGEMVVQGSNYQLERRKYDRQASKIELGLLEWNEVLGPSDLTSESSRFEFHL